MEIAKDTWKSRLIERVVWTLLSAVLLRYGIVATNGFVTANDEKAVAEIRVEKVTEQRDVAVGAFGRYIADRLERDAALEPVLIECMAAHTRSLDDLARDRGYQGATP